MNPANHPDYLKQRDAWEARLAAEGLADPDRVGVGHGSHTRTALTKGERSGRRAYAQRVMEWLWEQVWRSRLERRTWELHAEGHPVRTIERLLGTMRGSSYRLVELRLQAERARMFAAVGSERDEPEQSAFDAELAGFDWVRSRGEGKDAD